MNFELPHIPERSVKPRTNGLTMVMDKGLSLRQAEDFLEMNADLTDLVKLGFGTSYVTKNIEQKIKLYKDAGIKVYLGGTLFEAFIIRGMFDDYVRLVDKLKLECTEVSDGSISIPHDVKCEYIQKLAKNYTVLSEVGSKEAGIIIHPAKWTSMMNKELQAGSWKVIAEARESGNVGIYRPNGSAHVMLINKILSKVNKHDILWEAPQKPQQVWFLKLLGSDVNLGNISYDDVIPLETLRLGLRGDTFFSFLPKEMKSGIIK
jgi:phosphosulfolactate synthase